MTFNEYPHVDDEQYFPAFLTSGAGTGYVNVPYNASGSTGWICRWFPTKVFRFSASTNALYVKILGAVTKDSTGNLLWTETALAETLVAVGSPVVKKISDQFLALKVQVKRVTDDDTHNGTLSAYCWGSSNTDTSNVTVEADVNTAEMEVKQDAANALLGQLAADIALMKVDLAAIRAILES